MRHEEDQSPRNFTRFPRPNKLRQTGTENQSSSILCHFFHNGHAPKRRQEDQPSKSLTHFFVPTHFAEEAQRTVIQTFCAHFFCQWSCAKATWKNLIVGNLISSWWVWVWWRCDEKLLWGHLTRLKSTSIKDVQEAYTSWYGTETTL